MGKETDYYFGPIDDRLFNTEQDVGSTEPNEQLELDLDYGVDDDPLGGTGEVYPEDLDNADRTADDIYDNCRDERLIDERD